MLIFRLCYWKTEEYMHKCSVSQRGHRSAFSGYGACLVVVPTSNATPTSESVMQVRKFKEERSL